MNSLTVHYIQTPQRPAFKDYYLASNNYVSSGYEWAFFGVMGYIEASQCYYQQMVLEPVGNGEVRIRVNQNGKAAYLAVNHWVPLAGFQKAFFGTSEYLSTDPTYTSIFTIENLGNGKCTIASHQKNGSSVVISYLSYKKPTSAQNQSKWDWAIFSTEHYLEKFGYSRELRSI